MKLVHTHENHFIISNIKNLIEAQGIKVFIKNEFAQGALGETSAFDCWPEIWVFDDQDFDAANKIFKESQALKGTEDWKCKSCGEKNDPAFEICWRCESDRP